MKRLLCIISNMNAGGAETFLMKIYRQLDKTKYQMDFCLNTPDKCFYEDEIEKMGGKIYRIPSKSQNRKAFEAQLTDVVKSGAYKYVLRITSNAMGFMDLKIAKQAGAKICAVRSSNSSDGGGWKPWLAHRLGQLLFGKYVDVKFAPSDLAAKYTFGDKAYKAGKVTILHNAVDLGVFHYDANGRQAIRKEFGIADDTLLVGHVGRFMPQKNHKFLLSIFAEITKQQPNSKLLLVGKGELERELRGQVAALHLTDKVIFAGVRSDIPAVLSAMDVFVFPSFYEGMPNTVIEAQATGLPVVLADTITKEADITGLLEYRSLEESADCWTKAIMSKLQIGRIDYTKAFMDNRYDMQSVVEQFITLVF